MTKWLQWMVLSSLTGSPLLSIVILILFWWAADRFTFRLLPDPLRPFLRWQRMRSLERELADNPHNRLARFELADLYVAQRRHGAAVDVLRPNVEAGDEDPGTLFLLGVALSGSGHPERGEQLFQAALEHDHDFRLGAIQLEQGRWRLARGDAAGAKEALLEFLKLRSGTVEGRVLMARALEKLGDSAGAEKMRSEAWREFASSPAHIRRLERFWAWRAKPMRPLLYLVVIVCAGAVFGQFLAPPLRQWLDTRGHHSQADD